MDRNRYADLLRVVAMSGVVCGHWLLISVTYAHGRLSGLDEKSHPQSVFLTMESISDGE